MESKHWIWIYNKIKDYVKTYSGNVPDDEISGELMKLYTYVMDNSTNNRAASKKMDEELTNIFGYLFKIVHSLELEGKPL